jgi:hypothetical protein
MAYWWEGRRSERYGVEIRKLPGHGLYLAAPRACGGRVPARAERCICSCEAVGYCTS